MSVEGRGVSINVTGGIPTGGTTGQSLKKASNTDLDATWQDDTVTVLADGKIIVGNGSNVGAAVTPSGDLTMANTGAFTIGNDKVTYAKMQNVTAADRLLGRSTAGAGDVEEITVGGDITQSGSTFTIGSGKITSAKMATLTTTIGHTAAVASVSTTTVGIDLDAGGIQTCTLTDDGSTATITKGTTAKIVVVNFYGAHTVTTWVNVDNWDAGSAPTFSGSFNRVTFLYDGTTVTGSWVAPA